MKRAIRGYHPGQWYWPLLKEKFDQLTDYLTIYKTEKVVGEAFPIVVLEGPRDILRQMEYNYDTAMRSLFPGKSYDELKKIKVEEIKKALSN